MTEPGTLPYKSRRGGLIFFGLVELAMGALSLLVAALTILSLFIAPAQQRSGVYAPSIQQMIPSAALYLFGGALLATLGVGSILGRRWARDLSLVIAWMWLLIGVTTTAVVMFMVPRILRTMPSAPVEAGTIMLTCMAIVFGIFGIVVPLAMILFYRSPHVRETCVALDPHPRWTERSPLPLLGLSLWLAFSAVCMIGMSSYAVLPLGRQIITGPIAVMTYCAIGLLLLYVSWGVFARSLLAWWVGMAYGVLIAVYCVVIFPHLDFDAVVRAMRMPKTPTMPDLSNIYRSPWFLGWLGVFWVLYFGYFLFVLRYLKPAAKA